MRLCFSHGLSVAGAMTLICSFVLLALNVILASVPSAAISKQIVLAAWKDFHFIKAYLRLSEDFSFLIQFYKTVVSEYLILFVVNLETNICLNPT